MAFLKMIFSEVIELFPVALLLLKSALKPPVFQKYLNISLFEIPFLNKKTA
jgi:hypothetical protein